MNAHTFITKFVTKYQDEFNEALEENEQTLSKELLEDETFKNWFNEDWVADRWIDYVDCVVGNLSEEEQTAVLVDHGLDNVFEMCRLIGLFDEPERITTEKLTWHVIDHWYTYTSVVTCFAGLLC